MDGLLDWLAGLPPAALVASLALVAAIENVFPPFPADTIVAFGAFLAARGEVSLWSVAVGTWAGNVAGAGIAYAGGRRLGAAQLRKFLARKGQGMAESRLESLYGRYGLLALFVSRFLPGVRALVPPVAGALRIPATPALVVMALASAIWYGVISYLAFRLGDEWERVTQLMQRGSATLGIAVGATALAAFTWWWLRRRKRLRNAAAAGVEVELGPDEDAGAEEGR